MKSFLALLLGAAALVGAAYGTAAETPKTGGVLKFAVGAEPPNYDCHAQTSFAFIHPVRPHYSTLLEFDTAKYPGDQGRPRRVVDGREGRAYLHVQAEEGRQVSRRLDLLLGRHQGDLRPPAQPAAGRALDPAGELRRHRVDRDARSADRGVQAEEGQCVDAHQLREPVGLRLQRREAEAGPEVPRAQHHGHRALYVRRARRGLALDGRKFDGYFEKGKPYLSGFLAIFIAGAPMVNALAAGEVLAEFRGHSPADRDRLVKALGDKAMVQETPWVCSLVVTFNTKKKPFDDVRVRQALSLGIDRWGGAQALSKIALVRHVGGILRPGYDLAANEKELLAYPGFSKDINASRAQARKMLQEAGVPNLTFTLTNRNVAMPYTPVGVFLIDQWRQIGVNVKHEQLETRLYLAAQQRDNPTFDAALDFNCDFMDEPNLQLQKYLSHDRSTINYAQQTDRVLDDLFDKQSGELDKKKRYAILREFEKRALDQAYTIPTIWWHRIIVTHKQMKGWHITPSHYVGQDLADVWLDQ